MNGIFYALFSRSFKNKSVLLNASHRLSEYFHSLIMLKRKISDIK